MVIFASLGHAQVINFPDPALKAKLLEASPSNAIAVVFLPSPTAVTIDQNGDGEIQINEVQHVNGLYINGSGISSLAGLEHFTQLKVLECDNNNLTSADFSPFLNLYSVSIRGNQLTSLLPPPILNMLYADNNLLAAIDLSNLSLSEVDLQNNVLAEIFLDNSTISNRFDVSNNQLMSFNLHNASTFCDLNLSNNPLLELNVSGEFRRIDVGINNNIETLDLSGLVRGTFAFNGESLRYVNAKTGHSVGPELLVHAPNLEFVCADEHNIASYTQDIQISSPDCVVNSYCSFTPGGVFYELVGTIRYDMDNDGCSPSDPVLGSIKMGITNGIVSGSMTSDGLGNYQIPVQAGMHTITPDLENPTYFNVSPSGLTVSFPAEASPNLNDFCITANGDHSDLEVAMLPLGGAIAGFDAYYKLIYKNKGTVSLSGTLSLSHGNTTELISTEPAITNQASGSLHWNFTNLQPFEQREITVVMNINSPQETPAVNDGDVLNFTVLGTHNLTEETPSDNTATLAQTVVNSFDPNDKTCLEGDTVGPEIAGKYVHYQIRFENTGTANAQNIVVKDEIDATKFDITTLVPLDASHNFYTRINGNKVEFIFENIQLPFDDANNDGYVMFKIKTKPTLVVGDSFSNSASIYFDYNHPIVTEPAVTTIQLLGTQDFDFASEFALYPNPTSDLLTIQSKAGMRVDSAEIYNTLGQIVMAVTSPADSSKIEVSALQPGVYLVRLRTARGHAHAKFVKQ